MYFVAKLRRITNDLILKYIFFTQMSANYCLRA